LLNPHPFSTRATARQAHLRIMETTDLHMHVFPYNYYTDRPDDSVGLARTATHIAHIRAEAENTLLIDNGDFLQGNPMGDYIAYERGMKEGDLHPIIQAMNTLGFDASTLGNHEFNYGLSFLMKSLAGANFPIISANVITRMAAHPTGDKTLVPPYVILNRQVTDGAGATHPIRIGLIGFVPPQIMNWDRRHLEGSVQTRDIIETARAYIPQMKEQGADIILALSHSGIGAARHREGMENASVPLAELDGIDALLTGHSHLVFPSPDFSGHAAVDAALGTIHGKPAVMGGFWGSDLGLIDLLLENEGGSWRVITHEVATRKIARRNPDQTLAPLVDSQPTVLAAVQAEHDATLAYVRRPVGRTTAPLHSYFALVADDPSVQIVADAQRHYIADMLQGTEHAALPILSATAPFKAGGRAGPDNYTDVPVGNVAIKHVADLYLYPNTIRAVKITGAQLRLWLERAAGIYNQITPGTQDQPLLNPAFPSYHFDMIDGVRYQIDLTQPSRFDPKGRDLNPDACRIINLTYLGQPVRDDMEFIVATNSYRAGGGGDFPGAEGDTIIFEGPDTNRDILIRYIMEQGEISPVARGNWTFAPLPGTSVIFDTGPGAAKYADQITTTRITPKGLGAGQSVGGFARFRIIL
jgi:2',3'-cyclic-nucleotide 2'-phosphodiesterase/3'-nucleotidase